MNDKSVCDLHIATSGLCGKSEEMRAGSCTRNKVLRVDCEFSLCHYQCKRKGRQKINA